MKNDRYDSKADVYSFGICLVAMTRADESVVKFFFEGLRRHLKKDNFVGLGLNVLNQRMTNNFRPALPPQLYPTLKKLIFDCWQGLPAKRPTFDDIVLRLSGEVSLEVNRLLEPDVSLVAAADSTTEGEGGLPMEGGENDEKEHQSIAREVELVSLRTSLEEEKKKSASLEKFIKELQTVRFSNEGGGKGKEEGVVVGGG